MESDTWMVALSLDKDKSWLDDPLTGFSTFREARDEAYKKWPKLEEGESYAFYKCMEIITLKIITLKSSDHDDPTPPDASIPPMA